MKRIFAFALLLSSLPAMAQAPLPQTRAGQVLGDLLSAVNAPDNAHLLDVVAKYHFAPPPGWSPQSEGWPGFAHLTEGFTLLRVEKSSENSLTALFAERNNDTIARGTLTLATDADGAVTRSQITMLGTDRGTEFAIPRMTREESLKALEEEVYAEEQRESFSGAYLIAQDGKVLAAKAFGWEDRESGKKATLETKFRNGSMNKMFTAVAVLQLVEAKKLSLNGTVGIYLPDYPNRDIASKVTIRQLLSHTGGTGDFFGPEFNAKRLTIKTHADYMALFGKRAPQFEPGSRDAYSNYGILLLGNIIEKVSGMSYYDYVAKHIYAPAGMTSTGSLSEEQTVPNRATAYMWKGNGWASAADTLPYRGTSAGGGYTTVGDLLKFAQALQTGKLLPGRLVADATTAHNHGGWYGYGFMISGQGMLQEFGHDGGARGQSGEMRIYPALGTVIIALSNYDPDAATNLVAFYANRMPATR